MRFETFALDDGIAAFKISGSAWRADSFGKLASETQNCWASGRHALIFDFKDFGRLGSSGLGALLELIASQPRLLFLLCSLPRQAREKLERSGLDRALHLFPDFNSAFNAELLTPYRLTKTKCLFFKDTTLAQQQTAIAGLNYAHLDVLGRSSLSRQIEILNTYGLDSVFLPMTAKQARLHLHHEPLTGKRPHPIFLPEFTKSAQPLALSLAQFSTAQLSGNETVICANDHKIITADLAAAVRHHKATNAGLTVVAATDLNGAHASQKEPCLFVVNANIFEEFAREIPAFDAQSIVTIFLKLGITVAHFDSVKRTYNLVHPHDYVALLRDSLSGKLKGLRPTGREIEEGVWVANSTKIGRRARFTGRSFLAEEATVESGSRLNGINVIGNRAVVEKGCELTNSVLLNDTRLSRHRKSVEQLMHPKWEINLLSQRDAPLSETVSTGNWSTTRLHWC